MASMHCDDDEAFAPAAVNPAREDSMQDILLSAPPSSAGSEHSDFSRKSHGRDDTPELVYDSQQSNESELFSSQEQIDPSGNQTTSSRSPRREDPSSQEELDPLCNDHFIGIASPGSQPLEDLEHLIRFESTTERKGRKLRPIEEVCSDDEGKESESVDDYEGSASSQESLSREMGRLAAGPDSTNYSEMEVEDAPPGPTSRASSSPSPSRKRKASNELTPKKEKSPRKLLENLALPTLFDAENETNAQVDIGIAEDHKPTSSFPLRVMEIAPAEKFVLDVKQPSDLADDRYLTPEQDKSQEKQALENTTGFPTHGVRGSKNSDIPTVVSLLEVADFIRAASEPPYIYSDDQHLTLDDDQEEQENTTGSPTNSVHSSQSSDIPAVVSSLAVVQPVRAASEPCNTPSILPNIQAISKRRVNMDSVAELAKHNLVASTVELMRTKRKWIRNRTINPLPRLRPRMVETGGYGPQLYEATSGASSVIYWPEEIGSESEHGYSAEPTPSAGLDELPTYLPNGGSILSVHQPTTTLAWLEENYDHPMLKSIRKSRTFSGPLAMMLFTDKPALALFGPSTPSRARLAQKLANKCKAPVIARSSEDDPMIRIKSLSPDLAVNGPGLSPLAAPQPVMSTTLGNTASSDGGSTSGATSSTNDSKDRTDVRMRDSAQPPTSETPIPGSSGGNVGAVQREMDTNDDDPERSDNDSSNASSDDSEQITVVSESIASSDGKKTKGKDGDPDDDGDGPSTEADKWEDWLSPHHTISMQIQLQRNGDRPPIQVDIACQTQFKTYADERMPLDPNIEWTRQAITRPQAQVHTEFKLRFMSEGIILDRSYAVLGLQGHRPYSIIDDQNLDCGFEEPTKTLKTIFSENIQNSLGVTAGFTGVHPAPTVKATYSRNKSSTHGLEATDSEPAPLYTVTPSPGESYLQREGKSYRSYNYAYAARDDLFCRKDRKMPPPTIGFAYGINFNHYNSEHERLSPPRVSYINRNQIFVWVEDPSLRSKILGTVMLFSDYVKNIRTPSQLTTVNECTVELETGKKIHSFSSVARDARDGAISLDVVPVHQEKYTPEAVQYKGPSTLKRLGTRAAQAAQKISRRPPSPQLTLVPQEVVARGWDVTNCRWRDAIYPELDKHLRVPRAEDPSLVAFQISSYELPVP